MTLTNGPEPLGVRAPAATLADLDWQMGYGERTALEGILSQIKPQLAVEVGTAQGGSLARIAAHSVEVHSFDLVPAAADVARLENVHFHHGDSHQLLPDVLASFAVEHRNVDFALVDGDHSAPGVRRDLEDLLGSDAVGDSLILMHDPSNEEVRAGLEAVDYDAYAKVAYVELDWVPGYLMRKPPWHGQIWGGLGLVVTARGGRTRPAARQERYYEAFSLLQAGRSAVLADDTGET